ncbi:uncharacterized protein LOC143208106 [Lasioglossum baleicum]|uniref:uncharacterized protein LOC143208106 n=1 Tax=Lasioglossum baleicum TaxID=434251 RepID=UPI003FCE8308
MDDWISRQYRAFHPKDPAHGSRNYDIGALSRRQKKKLNLRKTTVRKENEIYLTMHPEIKGLISLLLKCILCSRPDINIHETVGEFFNRPRRQILLELLDYFLHTNRSDHIEFQFQRSTNVLANRSESCCCNVPVELTK